MKKNIDLNFGKFLEVHHFIPKDREIFSEKQISQRKRKKDWEGQSNSEFWRHSPPLKLVQGQISIQQFYIKNILFIRCCKLF